MCLYPCCWWRWHNSWCVEQHPQFKSKSTTKPNYYFFIKNTLRIIKHFQIDPAVGIIPLGTGNDLSRVLGWGTSYSDSNCFDIMDSLDNVSIIKLDRLISLFYFSKEITVKIYDHYFC